MGEWIRSTRLCLLENLPVEVKTDIQMHIDTYNLGSILDDALACIETVSDKKKKGLFGGGGDKSTVIYAVLTPRWLVWLVRGDKSGSSALSARLSEIVVSDYAQTPGYKLLPDTGIEISGSLTGRVGTEGNQRVSMFIPLGEELAAQKFKQALLDAVQAAKL